MWKVNGAKKDSIQSYLYATREGGSIGEPKGSIWFEGVKMMGDPEWSINFSENKESWQFYEILWKIYLKW